jgi:hypothetical protein
VTERTNCPTTGAAQLRFEPDGLTTGKALPRRPLSGHTSRACREAGGFATQHPSWCCGARGLNPSRWADRRRPLPRTSRLYLAGKSFEVRITALRNLPRSSQARPRELVDKTRHGENRANPALNARKVTLTDLEHRDNA